MRLRILNSREIKKIIKQIKEQWDADVELDYVFLISSKNKVYVVNRDIGNIDYSRLNVNNCGLYFCNSLFL